MHVRMVGGEIHVSPTNCCSPRRVAYLHSAKPQRCLPGGGVWQPDHLSLQRCPCQRFLPPRVQFVSLGRRHAWLDRLSAGGDALNFLL